MIDKCACKLYGNVNVDSQQLIDKNFKLCTIKRGGIFGKNTCQFVHYNLQ